jgi:DNA-binding response OmpR family regulator
MSRKALIIDDEPDTATYLGTLLSDNGWDVRTANDVNTGLALAREETPDVVLLDLMTSSSAAFRKSSTPTSATSSRGSSTGRRTPSSINPWSRRSC